MITFNSLPGITNGKIVNQLKDYEIRYLAIDSRKIISSPHTLFFAIKGDRHDGHNYLESLVKAGITNFVVETDLPVSMDISSCNILKVKSSTEALQHIAANHRAEFTLPVIGITGSSGKTIVKEWLFQLLQGERIVFRSPKSYNSQVGVPLSVWQMNAHHELAIIEAGISKPGEMEKLERIIKPEIGLFTNIGTAHDSGFASREEKAREKTRLFKNCKLIIFCRDDLQVENAIKELGRKKTFTWSATDKDADLQIVKTTSRELVCRFNEIEFTIEIPGDNKASIDNSSHCIAALLSMGIPVKKIKESFKNLQPVSMRLELKKGINNCPIIDDSYNNDLMGLEIALDFLTHQSKKGKKTVILSDILTSGIPDEELYQLVDKLLDQKKISRLIGVGPGINSMNEKFTLPRKFFETTEELLKELPRISFENETILVKGARDFKLEKVVDKLVLKIHSTVLEINLDALTHNLNYYKSKLKPAVEIMAMVKAFAYGSGSVEIARWLQFHQVNYLAVAYADEGLILRSHGVEIPIMVMNPTPDSFDKLISYNLEPEIYSEKILKSLLNYLSEKAEKVSIHLKTDTGMHRLGFDEEELNHVKELLQNEKITVESVFTHLAAQENADQDEFTRIQIQSFEKMYTQISGWIETKPKRHVLNSAGILRFPEFHYERVRLGIGLYGIDPIEAGNDLMPVGTFRTLISQVKKIKPGETIGYGRIGKAEQGLKIATIPVGYADGFNRRFSNGVGQVIINNKRAKVIGNVCMDMTMIDITDIDASEGDEVIIYGAENPIDEMAKKIGTISYELLTGIGERVKRVFVQET
jgi:alanine racemase